MSVQTLTSAPSSSGRYGVARGTSSPRGSDIRFVILRHAVTCSEALGLNKGDLAVLRALLYCLHNSDGTVVFACNATLSQHADGMPVRTLSRHLGRLVAAGLVARNDSPTRRRYVRRAGRRIVACYGIDMQPLFDRKDQLAELAIQTANAVSEAKALLDNLSCLANRLFAHGIDDDLVSLVRKERRRKLNVDRIMMLTGMVEEALARVTDTSVANIMADTDSQNGRPNQKAILEEKIDSRDMVSKPGPGQLQESRRSSPEDLQGDSAPSEAGRLPTSPEMMTPGDVIRLCPEALEFADGRPLRSWSDLAAFAWDLALWMSIDPGTIRDAGEKLGLIGVSATILGICQSGNRIRSPGAYLRKLGRTAGFNAATFLRRLPKANVVRGQHCSL